MKKFFYLILIISLGACAPKESFPYEEKVITHAKEIIDNELINSVVVSFSEIYSNEKITIYSVCEESEPLFSSSVEAYASFIYPYKGKYICIFRNESPPMTFECFERKFPDFYENEFRDGEFRFVGYCLLKHQEDTVNWLYYPAPEEEGFWDGPPFYYEIPEIWPYLTGYYEMFPVQMMLEMFNLDNIDKGFSLQDLMEEYPTGIRGRITLYNLSDSLVIFPVKKETGGYFGLLNGNDIIPFSIVVKEQDSLYINLPSKENYTFSFELKDSTFFHSLTPYNDQTPFYNMMSNSIYYFPTLVSDSIQNQHSFYSPDSPVRLLFSGQTWLYIYDSSNNIKYFKGKIKSINYEYVYNK